MLDNKTILILGGSGLIGQEVTRAVLQQHASVIVAGRSDARHVFADVPAEQAKRLSFKTVDLQNPNSVESLFQNGEDPSGRIHAIVNCSFPRNEHFGDKFEDVSYENFCDNVTIHLGSAFLVSQKAAAYFASVEGGNIVHFSSIYGFLPPRFELYDDTPMTKEVEYAVCKSGIIQLTKYLAKYLKGKNIRVNCVSPGGVLSGTQPDAFLERYNAHGLSKGMLDGRDVAGTVLFLLSDLSAYMNGQNLVIDDGFSL